MSEHEITTLRGFLFPIPTIHKTDIIHRPKSDIWIMIHMFDIVALGEIIFLLFSLISRELRR